MSTHKNIAAHLPEMAAKHPDALAVLVQLPGKDTGPFRYAQYTLKELDEASNRLAAGLQSVNIGRGTRTVLMVQPSLEFFALTFALFKSGAVPVMVDPGMGLKNLKQCLDEAEPQAFIGIPKAHVARVLFGWGKRTLLRLVTVGPRLFWGGHRLKDLAGHPAEPLLAEPDPGEMAAILFTSGSTGVPKGVVYTHEIFNAQVESLRRDYGITPGERDLATFPLFALFGPALGMAAIIPDMDASKPGKANPRKIIAAIQDQDASNMFGSPALLDVLGRHAEEHGTTLPTLRRVISAGAPADLPSLRRCQAMLTGKAEIFPSYGATEALPVAHIGSKELFETAEATDAGAGVCVGRPVQGVDARVIAITEETIRTLAEAEILPPGEIGEIVVSGPVVTREYFNRPQSTGLAKIADPGGAGIYHRMGDLGYFDEQGRLWMCGRKSQRVETRARSYYTIPCERIFNTHAQVRRSALVGVPAAEAGPRRPVVCIELEANVPSEAHEQIFEELRALAASHEILQGIEDFLVHPEFPVDVRHNAKIFREQLATWAEKQMGVSQAS